MSKHLIPFITAGHPQKDWLIPLIKACDAGGADFIEVGIPFSDPIADGPTIQEASQVALDNGTTLRWVLEQVASLKGVLKARLILFSYYNPVMALGGVDAAAQAIKSAGFHGVLIPDMALEESAPFVAALHAQDLHYIPLIAPTTSEARLAQIGKFTTSFAYGVSVTGVTGARQGVSVGLDDYLARVRRNIDKEFVVGFGISTPEDAARIARVSDGVVVGSAIVKKLGTFDQVEPACAWLQSFVGGLKDAISS